jgi:hypothetical protein
MSWPKLENGRDSAVELAPHALPNIMPKFEELPFSTKDYYYCAFLAYHSLQYVFIFSEYSLIDFWYHSDGG